MLAKRIIINISMDSRALVVVKTAEDIQKGVPHICVSAWDTCRVDVARSQMHYRYRHLACE